MGIDADFLMSCGGVPLTLSLRTSVNIGELNMEVSACTGDLRGELFLDLMIGDAFFEDRLLFMAAAIGLVMEFLLEMKSKLSSIEDAL